MDAGRIQQLTDEARTALESGNHVRAVAITEQLATIVPDDPVVWALRAEALVKSDPGEEALSACRRAVELDPESPHLHSLLGLAAWGTDRLTLAQQSFERAVELAEEDPRLVADFAFFLAAARGPRLAEAAANEAVCADGKCAAAWAARGLAQFRHHRRLAAEASLTRALELDPNDPYAQAAMLALLYERRDTARAMALGRLLNDGRGTEQFVATQLFFRAYGFPHLPGTEGFTEDLEGQARKRQVARELIERHALRDPTYFQGSHWQFWACVVLSMLIVAGLAALVVARPDLAPIIILFGLIPLFLLWATRRLFD